MGATLNRCLAFAQLGLSGLFMLNTYHAQITGDVGEFVFYLILGLVNLALVGHNWQSAEEGK